MIESTTNVVILGMFNDDAKYTALKTFLCQTKPMEVVVDSANITPDVLKIFQSGYLQPMLSYLNN